MSTRPDVDTLAVRIRLDRARRGPRGAEFARRYPTDVADPLRLVDYLESQEDADV
ncbi:hypothetical protein ACFJIY_07540 [Pimelobacter simplex]|uniref:hypothetical protein n=1 Tax=Nocardioides simplex TaxID=2045 RepID=UPI00366C51BD